MKPPRFGPWLTTSWVRIYTRGLASEARTTRTDEIRNDLWEHQHDHFTRGIGSLATSTAIASRAVRGVPADLSWRRRQRSRVRANETEGVTMSTGRLWAFTRALIVAQGLTMIVVGASVFGGIISDDSNPNWNADSGAGFAGLGIAILVGLAIRRRWSAAGVILMCVGSLFSIGLYWYSPVFLIGLLTCALTLLTAPWEKGRLQPREA